MASNSPPSAEYKQLGKSGLRVSVPILGAMSFGDKRWMPWVIEEDEVLQIPSSRSPGYMTKPIHKALPLLKAAYDRGLNTVSHS